MGIAGLTPAGLSYFIRNGSASEIFTLQAGTGVPSGGKEGSNIGPKIDATRNPNPGGNSIVSFKAIFPGTGNEVTLQSVGLYRKADPGTCLGLGQIKKPLAKSQKCTLDFSINLPQV